MKKAFIKASLFVVLSTSFPVHETQAMTVTPFDTAENLAAAIVGTGITISNVIYIGSELASGYFTGGSAAGIGMNSGVILTSGLAINLDGVTNTSDEITGNNLGGGYSALDALVPDYFTYDATVLSFDFTFTSGTGGDAYFNFVFGSDEYNEWVDSAFNDVYGFFLDGTAINNNVAVIPGTSTPISINNVNNNSFSSYYNDNDSNNAFPFEYDGFTDVFTISMKDLSAGMHTMIIAIADAGDYIFDSGVFIQGSSFADEPTTPVPEPATLLLMGVGIGGLIGVKKRKS